MDSLELAVGQNLTISYRILRYLNSPLHGFSRRIESLRHGIALVGLKLISEWASMLLLDSIDEKPRELIITSMIRGHMSGSWQPRCDDGMPISSLLQACSR